MRKFIFVLVILFSFVYFIKASEKYNYKIDVDYPVTEYKKLNKFIDKKINYFEKLFLSEIRDNDVIIWDYYTLFINYKNYYYENILSYVFFVEYFVGGAHPNHAIFTVNYDTQKNIFIDVNSIQNIDAISVYARNNLIRDNRIVDTGMLLEGTKPTKDNFKNFVFTEDGYIFYFERYQVAPYSSGDISLIVPYDIEKGK